MVSNTVNDLQLQFYKQALGIIDTTLTVNDLQLMYYQGGGYANTPTLQINSVPGNTDTTRLQNAISAANTLYNDDVFIDLQHKTFSITGITLNNYTKLMNGKITRLSGTSPLIQGAHQASLQTGKKSILRDIQVDGLTRTTGTIGIYFPNHAAAYFQNVSVVSEDIGFKLQTQFGIFDTIKAYNCNVGVLLQNVAVEGSGNSNGFRDLASVGCTVNLWMENVVPSSFPMHSNIFENPNILGDATNLNIVGVAMFSCQAVFLGISNEVNANSGTATYTIGTTVAKRASMYLNGANISIQGGYIADAVANPWAVLENVSVMNFRDCGGYGPVSGQLVTCDATSMVNIAGDWGVQGSVENISTFKATTTAKHLLLVLPPYSRDTALLGIPANIVTPSQRPAVNNAVGATLDSIQTDAIYGNVQQLTYAAAVGDQNTSCVRFTTTLGAGLATSATFWIKSSVDAKIGICWLNFTNTDKAITLRAGKWKRIVFIATGAASPTSGLQYLTIYTKDTSAPVLQICRLNVVSSALTDGPEFRQIVNEFTSGGYVA